MAAMNFPNGPSLGDKYPVTPIVGQPQYTWDGEKWTTVGSQISNATPSAAVPLMDATPGLAGTAAAYSRGDHVHPTDTTRAALAYVDANMVGYAAQTTTANQKAQARANVALTKRNYVINGGMMVSQENGATASTGTVSYYPVDCFYRALGNTTGLPTAAQVASVTPGGSPNRLRTTVTTADAAVAAADYVSITTAVEGLRTADLRCGTASAKAITIQFGCKGPAGTYCVAIGNYNADRSYVAEYVIAAGEANSDVVKSVTLTLDTTGTWPADNTGQLWIYWTLMSGSNYQGSAGAWTAGLKYSSANQFNFMGTAGNVFELFDVSLTEGSIAPPFQLPDYASELALCQRYFEIITSTTRFYSSTAAAVTDFPLLWKTSKRTNPTVAISIVSGSRVNVAGVTIVFPTLYGAACQIQSNAIGDCYSLIDTVTASARL